MDHIEGIRIFKRVAETKSFSATALEFGVSQPTISKMVQALEKSLAITLFRRSTRGLSLTVEGQKLYNSGTDLIDHFDRVLSEVTSQKLSLRGELRISASFAFARIVLIPLLSDFEKLNPDLRLNFHLTDGFVDLIEDNIDVALRIGDLQDSSLRAVKIGSSARSVYASKSYLKKYGKPKTIDDLKNHKLMFYTRIADGPNWLLEDKNGRRKLTFEPYLKTDGSDLMREAVLSGLGIALMPKWFMLDAEREKSVERLFDEAVAKPMGIHAVSASRREMTSKQRAFIDFLRQRFDLIAALSIRS